MTPFKIPSLHNSESFPVYDVVILSKSEKVFVKRDKREQRSLVLSQLFCFVNQVNK